MIYKYRNCIEVMNMCKHMQKKTNNNSPYTFFPFLQVYLRT